MARKNALGRGLGALIDDAGDINNKSKPSASIHEINIAEMFIVLKHLAKFDFPIAIQLKNIVEI